MLSRIGFLLAAAITFGCASLAAAQETESPVAEIHVNLKDPKAEVSPTLYGIFIEDINHGVEGGLYAELIQNRSFEEGVLPPGMKLVDDANGGQRMEIEKLPPGVPANRQNLPWPWNGNAHWDKSRELVGWSLKNESGATGAMKLTTQNPMNSASSRSLEIAIPEAGSDQPQARVDLNNSGYWGINVQQNTPYKLRFFLRPGTFRGNVTASLVSSGGEVLAKHEFPDIKAATEWTEHKATLTTTGADPKAHFVLSFHGNGTLQIDYVSLFPPTFKDRPNGLCKDLAQYLADLKPAFIRWPGGCYVEGFSWESAPDFRRTLGPPEERPGMYQYWKYRSTDGFGYHEYLQFCEDIGAQPVYAVFGGMTVHPDDNVPLDDLQPYIQNALDAIEYAVGPATSKWGAERVKMGHPEPFQLKFVEIGNEHETPLYGEYYKRFRAAIKEKYPEITVIMSMYWSGLNRAAIARAGNANIDVIDEHAYHDDNWPRSNFQYFDRYQRGNWPVFVGEYASQRANGDWGGGLGDSLYLMMCERNSDLVKMACYAPLFRNIHDTTWAVNLIEFDNVRSFAHGSYYVQKAFTENRPDVNLACTTEVTPKPDPDAQLMAGKIGLGTWDTQAEFKEFRVYDENDKLVYSDDFSDLAGWNTPASGAWQVKDGVLSQTGNRGAPSLMFLKTPELKVGRITVKARRMGGREGFLIFFNASDRNRFLFANYGANGNQFSALQDHGVPDGVTFRGGRNARGPIENDRWYDLAVVIKAKSADMFLDGNSISSGRVEALPSVFTGAGLDKKSGDVIVKATNYNAVPLTAKIHVDGAASIGKEAKVITIEGKGTNTDNNFESPTSIKAVERTVANASDSVTVQLPPYSVNVVRIPAQP